VAEIDEHRRWQDREPVKIWVPLSGLIAVLVQTVAYQGYKSFYSYFDVRPEEVGYDYTSLFPRTIIPIAALSLGALMLLSLGSVALATVVALRFKMKEYRLDAELESRRVVVVGVGVLVLLAGIVVLGGIGGESVLSVFVAAIVVAAVVTEHALARRKHPTKSWVTEMVRPRAYHGGRRLFLIVLSMVTVLSYKDEITWSTMLLVAAFIYAGDRALPVLNRAPYDEVEQSGTSRWLVGICAIIVVTTVVAVVLEIFVTQISDSVRDQVNQVRAGMRLEYSITNPLSLAEPRAQRVMVRWSGPSVPQPFSGDEEIALMYFGQNNGTSVFLSTPPEAEAVYRLPTAMLVMREVRGGP
jgi:hypothetical protein